MPILDHYLSCYEKSFESDLFAQAIHGCIWVFESDLTTLNQEFKNDIERYWDDFEFAATFRQDWCEFIRQILNEISSFGSDHRDRLLEFLRSSAILFNYVISERANVINVASLDSDQILPDFSKTLSAFLNGICRTGSEFDFGSATSICDAIAQFHGVYASGDDVDINRPGGEALFRELASKFVFINRHYEIMTLLEVLEQKWLPQLIASDPANKVALFPARLFESMLSQAAIHKQDLYGQGLSMFHIGLPIMPLHIQKAVALRLSAYDPTLSTVDDYLRFQSATQAAELNLLKYWETISNVIQQHQLDNQNTWSSLETMLVNSCITPVMAILDMHPKLKAPIRNSSDSRNAATPSCIPTPRFSDIAESRTALRPHAVASPRSRSRLPISFSDELTGSDDTDSLPANDHATIQISLPNQTTFDSPDQAATSVNEYYAIAKRWQITRSLPGPVLLKLSTALHEKDPQDFGALMNSFLQTQAIAFIQAHHTAFIDMLQKRDPYHIRLYDYLLRLERELPKFHYHHHNTKFRIMIQAAKNSSHSPQQTFREFAGLLNQAFFFSPQSKIFKPDEACFYQRLLSFQTNFGFENEALSPEQQNRLLKLTLCLQANPQLLSLTHQIIKSVWPEAPALETLTHELDLKNENGLLAGHFKLYTIPEATPTDSNSLKVVDELLSESEEFVRFSTASRYQLKISRIQGRDMPSNFLPPLSVLHILFERFELSCDLGAQSLADLGGRTLEKVEIALGCFHNLLDEPTRVAYVRACLTGIVANQDLVWQAWEAWIATRIDNSMEGLTLNTQKSLVSISQILEWGIAERIYRQSSYCSWPVWRRVLNYLPPVLSLAGLSASLYFIIYHILFNPSQDSNAVVDEADSFYALVAVFGVAQSFSIFAPNWLWLRYSEAVSYLLDKPSPNRNRLIALQMIVLTLTAVAAILYSVYSRLFETIIATINGSSTQPTPAEIQAATQDEYIGFPSMMALIFLGSMFIGNCVAIGWATGFFAARYNSCTSSKSRQRYTDTSFNNNDVNMSLVRPTPQRVDPVTGLRRKTRADRQQQMQSIFPESLPPRTTRAATQLFSSTIQAAYALLPRPFDTGRYRTPPRGYGNPHDVRLEDL